jgi:hypothetical protein
MKHLAFLLLLFLAATSLASAGTHQGKSPSGGGDGSSPQNTVLPKKRGDGAVPAPMLNAPQGPAAPV